MGASSVPQARGQPPPDPLRESLTDGRDTVELAEWAGGLPQLRRDHESSADRTPI